MYNKAQGLPMNALVLGALAILVLVALISIFASGGGSVFGAFGSLISGATPSSVGQARVSCDSACSNLRLVYPSWPLSGTTKDAKAFKSEKYCKLTFDISKEVADKIAAKCYGDIGSSCSVEGYTITLADGCAV